MPDKSVFDTLFGEKAYRRGRSAVQRSRVFSALFSGFFGILFLSTAAARFNITDGNIIFKALGVLSHNGDLEGCGLLLAAGLVLFVASTVALWAFPPKSSNSSEEM